MRGNIFGHYWFEITVLHIFLSFYCLIKWFFHKDLSFIFFCFAVVLSIFGLSSACYDVVLCFILLRLFICVRVIQIYKTNLISQIYQIIVVSMLKN